MTLLTWAAFSVSGTTPELSTTTGDTVKVPCLFGEGTLRNIYWYYNDGTGPQKILVLAKGDLIIEPEYANRANLQHDNSTLILNDITVADQGTYRCDVDRQGQTAVPNINTKLNVFSLRPDTLPVISPCTGNVKSAPCSIHANQSFTLTCTLPNVYPVGDTELIWYQDGKRVSSTAHVTQNDDGTTDISRQIQVPETGNFTCNATYISANGRENTAVSVKAWIILSPDVPNTPGKNLTSGQIAGIAICVVLLVVILLAIITLSIYCWGRRGFSTIPRDDPSNIQSDQEINAQSNSNEDSSSSENISDTTTSVSSSPQTITTTFTATTSATDSTTTTAAATTLATYTATTTTPTNTNTTSTTPASATATPATATNTPATATNTPATATNTPATATNASTSTTVPATAASTSATNSPQKEASKLPGKSAENCSKDEKGITVQYKSNKDSSATHISAGEGDRPTPQNSSAKSQQDQASAEPSKPSERPTEKRSKNEKAESSKRAERAAGNRSQNEAAESSKLTEGTAEKRPKYKEVDNSTLPPSPTMTKGRNVNRSDGRTIKDEEIIKLSKLMPGDKYSDFCVAIKIDINNSNNIIAKHQLNYPAAFQEILKNWSTKTGGFTQDLDEVLEKAELGGLRYKYKIAN